MRIAIKCPRCKKQIAWKIDDLGDKYSDYIECNPDGSGEYEPDNESYCVECHTLYCSNCLTHLEREYDNFRYRAGLLDFKCEKCLKKEGIELSCTGRIMF